MSGWLAGHSISRWGITARPSLIQIVGPYKDRYLDRCFVHYLYLLFDLTQLANFADDNYCIEWDTDLAVLVIIFFNQPDLPVSF